MQQRRQFLDFILSLIFFLALAVGGKLVPNGELLLAFPLFLISRLAYRYGLKPAVGVAVLAAILQGLIYVLVFQEGDTTKVLLIEVSAVLAALPGFFAKNVHRTLNNKKMSSVWLNVVVAQVLVGLGLLLNLLAPALTLTTIALYEGLTLLATMVAAYTEPRLILTKRSAFLSAKERSKLLND